MQREASAPYRPSYVGSKKKDDEKFKRNAITLKSFRLSSERKFTLRKFEHNFQLVISIMEGREIHVFVRRYKNKNTRNWFENLSMTILVSIAADRIDIAHKSSFAFPYRFECIKVARAETSSYI